MSRFRQGRFSGEDQEAVQNSLTPVVLAACDMFRAVCWKQANEQMQYINKTAEKHD